MKIILEHVSGTMLGFFFFGTLPHLVLKAFHKNNYYSHLTGMETEVHGGQGQNQTETAVRSPLREAHPTPAEVGGGGPSLLGVLCLQLPSAPVSGCFRRPRPRPFTNVTCHGPGQGPGGLGWVPSTPQCTDAPWCVLITRWKGRGRLGGLGARA